jgi:uncharacterized protein with GYD domain
MVRYVLLLEFTDKGMGAIQDSPARAAAFRNAAAKAGATIEAQYWTVGECDGVIVLTAPDETTAAAVTCALSKNGFVRTRSLRALSADEFKGVLAKVP